MVLQWYLHSIRSLGCSAPAPVILRTGIISHFLFSKISLTRCQSNRNLWTQLAIDTKLHKKISGGFRVMQQFKFTTSESSSSSSDSDSDEDDVTLEYHFGLPQILVPLPSRRERCKFTLRPVSNTVGDFLNMISTEDKGVDRALCKDMDGVRIASATAIEVLLQSDFQLVINDTIFVVKIPESNRITSEEFQRLGDIKNLVSQLYEVLHIKDYQVRKEQEIQAELETLRQSLQPMEEVRFKLENEAHRKSNWLSWAGLGVMSIQFGILARLTWWEYSWDIMEPVTYFVTYGTAMAAYTYFVITREEYVLNDVRNRQQLIQMYKKAKKSGFDVNHYNATKERIAQLEWDIKRLRDPIKLRTPKDVGVTGENSSNPVTTFLSAMSVFPTPANSKQYSARNAETERNI